MTSSAASECGPAGATGRGPLARFGPWLVLLWAPLVVLPALIPAVLEDRWADAGLYGAIGIAFVLAIVTFHRPKGRTGTGAPFVLVVLQSVLTAAAVLTVGDSGTVFMLPPLLVIAVAVVTKPRLAPALIGVVTLLAAGAAMVSGWQGGTVVWLAVTTLLSGLGTYAMFRLGAMVEELDRTRRELADAAVTAERLRFSRDLHDLLGHTLSVIVVKAEAVRRLAEADPPAAAAHGADIEQLGRSALAEVRQAVAGYREGSLAEELSRGAAALRAGGVRSEITPAPHDLDSDTQALLGWVVREGVTNVLRHSGASSCRIAVGSDGSQATVAVTDDGKGAATDDHTGSGLSGLAERVRDHGGRLTMGSDGTGFALRAEVPFGAHHSADREPAAGRP